MYDDFKCSIFYGFIILVNNLCNGGLPKWDGDECLSVKWGFWFYPVFKFCYNYIAYQELDDKLIRKTVSEYSDFLKFDNNAKRNDTDIELLYTFHLQTEVKVRLALKNVMNRIKTKNVISYFDYGKLMIALIAIQHNLPDDFDINLDDIENTMLERLNGLGGKINPENILRYQYAEQTSEEKERYELFKQRVTEALSKIHTPLSRFSYKNEQIQELYSYVHEERDRLLERGKLASYFDVNRFINFFMNCTAENIATLHIMFKEMYYRKNDLTEIKDRIEIIQIMNGIKCLESNENFDCIQKMQCKRFVNTLETIIEKSE